jgi:hypothetical protein
VAQVGLDCMRISTGPKHVNPWTKLYFLFIYKLELPRCDTNGTRLTELEVCTVGK